VAASPARVTNVTAYIVTHYAYIHVFPAGPRRSTGSPRAQTREDAGSCTLDFAP